MTSPEVDPTYEFDAPRVYDFNTVQNSDDEQRYIEEWFRKENHLTSFNSKERKEREYHSRNSQIIAPSSAKRQAFKQFVENRVDKKEENVKRYVPIQPSQKSLFTSANAQQAVLDKENNPNYVPPPPKEKVAVHTKLKPRLTVPRSPKLATARRQEAKISVLPDQPIVYVDPKPVRRQPPRAAKAPQPKPTQPKPQQTKPQPQPTKAQPRTRPQTKPTKPAPKPSSKPLTQTREFNFRTDKRKRNAENQIAPSKPAQKAPTASSTGSNDGNNRRNNNNNNQNNNNRNHNVLPTKKVTKKPTQPQGNKRKLDQVNEKNPSKKQCLRDAPPKEEKPVPFKASKVDESILHGPPRGVSLLPPMQLTVPQSPVLRTKVRSQFKTERKSSSVDSIALSEPQSLPKSLIKSNATKRRELTEPVPFKLQAEGRKKRKLEDDGTLPDKKPKSQEN